MHVIMRNSAGRLWCGLLLALGALVFAVAPAAADDAAPNVARISAMQGAVTIQRGDSGENVDASVNAPISVGDYLATAGEARAEVQIDDADFVRVTDNSQLRFTQLDPSDNELQLAAGTIEVAVLRYSDSRPQVETPSIKVIPNEEGSYRVVVDPDGNTWVTVRHGSVSLVSGEGTTTINERTSVEISGDSSAPDIHEVGYIALDDFDAWNAQRDQFAMGAFSSPAAGTDITGLADLGTYGNWQDNSQYGEVWVPNNQTADWAPYQDGRWAWEPYYGWTWVGYEPWGWAPYHYGRWLYT
ncbi:MAG: FecR domain-containing protein, partial [Candidatus Eremiobacteraeota bacterium]|nr:FecR domain-containing protein [Candidatus Eremiobacteraeota bacterium]